MTGFAPLHMQDSDACCRDFPTFLYQGPEAAGFGKNSSLTSKIGKTGLEKLNSLSYF